MLVRARIAWRLSLLTIVFPAGCRTIQPGTWDTKYRAPLDEVPPAFERIVPAPFEEVWDHLVHELAQSFFAINTVEKAPWIINVSFSSDSSDVYVDCGRTTQESRVGDNPPTRVSYETAEDSSYEVRHWYPAPNNPRVRFPSEITVRRETSLDGRVNIYVAPAGAQTQISVTAMFIGASDFRVG